MNVRCSFADQILFFGKVRPRDPAIISSNEIATYESLSRGIRSLERRIADLTLEPGAVVGVCGFPVIKTIILAAALIRSGLPVLILQNAAALRHLAFPIGALLHPEGHNLVPGIRQVLCPDKWFREDVASEPAAVKGFPSEDSIAVIFLSSGSTGLPKAYAASLKALNKRVERLGIYHGFHPWNRMLLMLGLSTAWGFHIAAHCFTLGRTLLFADEAETAIAKIKIYEIELAMVSTVQLRNLVKKQTRNPVRLSSLRQLVCGGSVGSMKLYELAREKLCGTTIIGYGSTEAGISSLAPSEYLRDDSEVGYIIPFVELEVVDDNDMPLGYNEPGTVRVKAFDQFLPYPIGSQTENFRDGWFYAGDIGSISPDGMLKVIGRRGELINVGGAKIAPERIEEIFAAHPDLKEVAAFSVKGELGIEEIVLAIIPSTGIDADQLIRWGMERSVRISRVHVVSDFPRSESGKVLRNQIKNRLYG